MFEISVAGLSKVKVLAGMVPSLDQGGNPFPASSSI